MGCCADSLFGCELLDLVDELTTDEKEGKTDVNDRTNENDDDCTLDINDRKVVLNMKLEEPIPMRLVVLLEENYTGGSGMNHGGVDGITIDSKGANARKRYLIILRDDFENDLDKTLDCLDTAPQFFDLDVGLVSGEVASCNKLMWQAAQRVLQACVDHIEIPNKTEKVNDDEREETESEVDAEEIDGVKEVSNPPVYHFVGRSIAGGVCSLAAAIADGSIPSPPKEKRRKGSKSSSRSKSRSRRNNSKRESSEESVKVQEKQIHGFAAGRASAVSLGPPPSISANIKAAFVTSVICGDDLICRSTKKSLDRLRKRVTKHVQGGALTKQMGWMTDTLSLTVSGLKSHAHGSEGEEARLSIPGRVYIVRPRRIGGGVSSMHEIGQGRDALRASVLWQLNDVLLSRSLWKHHTLETYISSIDKVQLRTMDDDEENDYYYE